MSRRLFDTNVLLDIATCDPQWSRWSEAQFRAAASPGLILINPIIYAELAAGFATRADLDHWLDPRIFERRPLPYEAGWVAAQAFVKYRRARAEFVVRRCRTSTSERMPRWTVSCLSPETHHAIKLTSRP